MRLEKEGEGLRQRRAFQTEKAIPQHITVQNFKGVVAHSILYITNHRSTAEKREYSTKLVKNINQTLFEEKIEEIQFLKKLENKKEKSCPVIMYEQTNKTVQKKELSNKSIKYFMSTSTLS